MTNEILDYIRLHPHCYTRELVDAAIEPFDRTLDVLEKLEDDCKIKRSQGWVST